MPQGPFLDICYRDPVTKARSRPLPWQQLFHAEQSARGRLAGGAFGAGKSLALCIDGLQTCYEYPGTRILYLRQTLKDVQESTMLVMFEDVLGTTMQEAHYHPLIRYINLQQHFFRMPNGSEIWWGGTRDSGGRVAGGARSKQFGAIYFDEIVEIPESNFQEWDARLRNPIGPNRWAAATNPEPNWVKQRFHPSSKDRSPNVAFFQTRTAENYHLPEGYEKHLRATYPEEWVKRYLDGSWDVFEGQIFVEFDREKHVRLFEIPEVGAGLWREFSSMDWGYRNPCAHYLIGVDYDDVAHIWGEYYQAEKRPSEVAAKVLPRVKARKIQTNLCDPSAWAAERDGVSVAEEFTTAGLNLVQANNDVEGSIQHAKRLFEEGRWRIHASCENLIRETPAYRWADLTPGREAYMNQPEEPVKKDDHAVDAALRYPANYLRAGGLPRPQVERPEDWLRRRMERLRRGSTAVSDW